MSGRWRKSTSVRPLIATLGVLERTAPGLGARVVERIWFPVPARRPSNGGPPSGGNPFEVAVGGRTVRGQRWGDGDEIVYLVHGWGGSSAQLGAFVEPLLEAGFSVVTHDALSHGQSDPGPSGPRRSTALEHLDVLRAVVAAHGPADGVIAHSLGSMVAAIAMRDGIGPASSTGWSAGSAYRWHTSTSMHSPTSSRLPRSSPSTTATTRRPTGRRPTHWRTPGRTLGC